LLRRYEVDVYEGRVGYEKIRKEEKKRKTKRFFCESKQNKAKVVTLD
jgi:hypothetical protein